MKKTLLLIAASIFTVTNVFSQQVVNNDFETWNDAGGYEEPQGWFTLNVGILLGDQLEVTKDVDAHGGTYSARIEAVTSQFLSGAVYGLLAYSPSGTVVGDAYTDRPASMEFYYKYAPVGVDSASGTISLSKWDSQNNVRVNVGVGTFLITGTVNAFTLATADITYETTDTPDSINVIFSSGLTEGSVLNIDDIMINMNSGVSIVKIPLEALSSVYPNPAKDNLYIKTNDNKATSIEITDLSGRTIDVLSVKGTSVINIAHLNDGNYLYNLKDGNVILSRGKFSVVK